MDSNTVTSSDLISGMLNEARRLGLSETTIWRGWGPPANSVATYYREKGLCKYSSDVTEEYLMLYGHRYESDSRCCSIRHPRRRLWKDGNIVP